MAASFYRTVAVDQKGGDITLAEKLCRAVGNSGNMLFESALSSQLADDVKRIHTRGEIESDLEMLVLSMSNFLSPYTDLTVFADIIEQRKVNNVVMIGCGAQAYNFNERIELKPGTRRFLDILSERSRSIGVRGVYTAEVLDSLGVKNSKVIGCPSIYWPMTKGWPDLAPDFSATPSYGIHCTPTGKFRDKIGALIRYGDRHDMAYLCQTEIAYLEEGPTHNDFKYYMGSPDAAEKAAAYFRRKGRIFFSIGEWVDFNRNLSFVIGSRFHGNVVTMLAGRPCLTLVFDTRTREMIEHFNLPYLHLDDFDEDRPVEFYERSTDFHPFLSTYRKRLAEYARFLDENGVPHKIGAEYRALLDTTDLDIVQRAATDALVHDAILTGMNVDVFAAQARLRAYKGRSAEVSSRIERGK